MGDTAEDILLSLTLSATEKTQFTSVLAKFESYFIVKRNTIFERARFNSRMQEETEPVDDFITSLYSLAEHCQYGALKDELIRDRIVVGVRERKLAEKLQLDDKLTLEKAVLMARQQEAVKQQQNELRGEPPSTSALNSVQKKKVSHSQDSSSHSNDQSSSSNNRQRKPRMVKNCNYCGESHLQRMCPAWGKECTKCGKKNHFAAKCRSEEIPIAEMNRVSSHPVAQMAPKPVFLGSINAVQESDNDRQARWNAEVNVDGYTIKFKLDPGADVTAIPLLEFKRNWKRRHLHPAGKVLSGPDGENLKVCGAIRSKLQHGENTIMENVFVVRGLDRPLLGLRACEDLKLVRRLNCIKSGLTNVNVEKDYPELFSGLGKINPPHKIQLKDGAIPFAIHTPRRVPLPLMEKVKSKLGELVLMDVIEPVDEPTEWCAPFVIVPKPNGEIRPCVDLTRLNTNVDRELHPMPCVEHTLGQLARSKVFSKLDANSGFYQIVLAPESRHLTTFLTPFGRYRFKRLPFGITSAPEVFQKRMEVILKGIKNIVILLDDILVFGATSEEHDVTLRLVLDRLKQNGVTLNDQKCEFGVSAVKFLGHILDEDGIRPDPEKVEAIVNLSPPTNVTEVRRLLGMINFLGKFVPNLSEICQPLNELLKADREFTWSYTQQQAFDKIKRVLTQEPVLALYDANRKTVVSSDASSYGLGAVLLQEQHDGKLRPISYASRTLSTAETRYAQIEKEALAATWACERFKDFLTGSHFMIETDHKPLLQILATKNLDDLSPRLQRFRLRLMRYSYDITYIPGKHLVAADALSRHPLSKQGDSSELEEEVAAYVCHIMSSLPASDEYLSRLWAMQNEDMTLKRVIEYCNTGWPHKSRIEPELKPYFSVQDDLTCSDGLLMRGCRLVIPKSMQEEVLGRIHEGHLGVVKCRARARESVWWPGLSDMIEQIVRKCPVCIKERKERHEPLLPMDFPTRPWQRVGMDLFKYNGKWFLLMTDYYSRYPEVFTLPNLTSETVINFCKAAFSRHGVPDEVISDNGPQFCPVDSSPFRKFAKEYGFQHRTSSPRYPQSNGFVENGVKIVKNLLKKNTDWYKAVLEYRATPLSNGFSPAELLFGRRIRSTLPMDPSRLVPTEVDQNALMTKERLNKNKQKSNYDHHHGVFEKDEPLPGEIVWVKDLRTWATVVEKADTPRSFLVDTPRGRFRRNTFHLTKAYSRKIPENMLEDAEVDLELEETSTPLCEEIYNNPSGPVSPQSTDMQYYRTRSGRQVKPPRRLINEI